MYMWYPQADFHWKKWLKISRRNAGNNVTGKMKTAPIVRKFSDMELTLNKFSDMELTLNKHPAVLEAVVLARPDVHGTDRTIAYIVPGDTHLINTLGSDLEDGYPGQPMPDGYVLVTSLPITVDGTIDSEELGRIEVIDSTLINKWKNAVAKIDNISQVELLPVERIKPVGSTHRMDLLHGIPHPDEGTTTGLSNETMSSPSATHDGDAVDPAIIHGRTLVFPDDHPKTLGQALRSAAEQNNDNGITYIGMDGTESFQTYSQLLADAEEVHAGLLSLGQKIGDKVIFQLRDNREFLVAFWGCVLGGMVPVPVSIAPIYMSSNATVQKLVNVWHMLEKPLVLASRHLVSELQSVLNPSAVEDARIEALDSLNKDNGMPEGAVDPEDLALLLLTSGSTGLPKAVMHNHQTLLNRSASSISFNKFNDKDVSLNWMPLDHVGGIVMFHLRDVLSGCTQVQAATDWVLGDPLWWLDLIEQHKVTISWAPNFAYALVLDRSEDLASKQWDLSSMRHLLNGGEAVVAKTASRFLRLLAPHGLASTVMKPAWGMSETASGITDSHNFSQKTTSDDDRTVEVGMPIPNISIRIVDDKNRLVNGSEKGNLQVKGPCIMTGYFQNPEANQKSFTSDGWLDTGDVGFLRKGCLVVTARTKDEIIINGINYPAAEIEEVANSVEGVEVSYSAACAVRRPESETDELAIFFRPSVSEDKQLAETIRTVRECVTTNVGIKPSYVIPLEKTQIPKTAIGKIQHASLRKGFENKEFDEELKRSDVLTEINTVPDWFFRKVWGRKEPSLRLPLTELGLSLVFVDRHGLGEALCEQLLGADQSCIVIEAGSEFSRLNSDRYCIDPEDRDHYRRLMLCLREKDQQIDQIVHLWTYEEDTGTISSLEELAQAQHHGVYSVLHLVQALAQVQGEAREVRLHMVGCCTQMTSADDNANCMHAAAVGLLKTIPLELSWLKCRHIDLEVGPVENNTRFVLDELRSVVDENEVAYRSGRRLVWGLTRVEFTSTVDAQPPVKRGGIYLITGGLGGIGAFLAQALMRDYDVKLILVGTTPLPARSEWPDRLEQGGKLAERIRRYLEMESLGGDFVYEPADVADLGRLQEIVAAAEASWRDRLAGIFHLAVGGDIALHWDNMGSHSVLNETVDSFERMFRAKVYGSWALYQIARERAESVIVPFGSVIGVFGAAHFGSYGAAHTFLNNLALQQRYRGGVRSCNFSWAVWDEIGLSQADPVFAKDLYRATGYSLIPKEIGLDCLSAGLFHDQPDLIVGLDAGNRNIRKYMVADTEPLQEIKAFFTTKDGAVLADSELKDFAVQDRYGATSQCEFVHLKEMPLTSDGEIDHSALQNMKGDDGAGSQEIVLPRNEAENLIAIIWHDVLAISMSNLGIHESFFQMGGNSLSAMQVLSRLHQTFKVKLSMRALFECATICELSIKVKQEQQLQTSDVDTSMVESMDPETLLANVDQMSDEEVARLLARMQGEQDH